MRCWELSTGQLHVRQHVRYWGTSGCKWYSLTQGCLLLPGFLWFWLLSRERQEIMRTCTYICMQYTHLLTYSKQHTSTDTANSCLTACFSLVSHFIYNTFLLHFFFLSLQILSCIFQHTMLFACCFVGWGGCGGLSSKLCSRGLSTLIAQSYQIGKLNTQTRQAAGGATWGTSGCKWWGSMRCLGNSMLPLLCASPNGYTWPGLDRGLCQGLDLPLDPLFTSLLGCTKDFKIC